MKKVEKIINYKNIALLQTYLSEGGKILPRRLTAATAKEQRQISKAIKIARVLALISPCSK